MLQSHQEMYICMLNALSHVEQCCGRWEHRPEHQRRLQRVLRKLQVRHKWSLNDTNAYDWQLVDSTEGNMKEMGKPPCLAATNVEWLKWIEDSGAAVTSLTRTLFLPDPNHPELGENGRGKLAAIQTAK